MGSALATSLAAPIWVITPQTHFDVAPDLAQPSGYQDQYKQLWGLG